MDDNWDAASGATFSVACDDTCTSSKFIGTSNERKKLISTLWFISTHLISSFCEGVSLKAAVLTDTAWFASTTLVLWCLSLNFFFNRRWIKLVLPAAPDPVQNILRNLTGTIPCFLLALLSLSFNSFLLGSSRCGIKYCCLLYFMA